jgi:hypothetical protein
MLRAWFRFNLAHTVSLGWQSSWSRFMLIGVLMACMCFNIVRPEAEFDVMEMTLVDMCALQYCTMVITTGCVGDVVAF